MTESQPTRPVRVSARVSSVLMSKSVSCLDCNRLRLFTYKLHGSFVLPMTQEDHLQMPGERYGVENKKYAPCDA